MPTVRGCAVVALALAVSACTAHSAGARQSPQSGSRLGVIRSAVLFPPEVKAFEIGAGGVPEEKEEWTSMSRTFASQALVTGFRTVGIELRPLEGGGDDVEEIRALSEAVLDAIVGYTYLTAFPEKVKRFEYSVGPVGPLLDRAGADALVFVWGSGFVPTTGRVILNALVGGPPKQAKMAVAVVDRSGAVLWFNQAFASGDGDYASLANQAGADGMAKTVLAEFPRSPQKR